MQLDNISHRSPSKIFWFLCPSNVIPSYTFPPCRHPYSGSVSGKICHQEWARGSWLWSARVVPPVHVKTPSSFHLLPLSTSPDISTIITMVYPTLAVWRADVCRATVFLSIHTALIKINHSYLLCVCVCVCVSVCWMSQFLIHEAIAVLYNTVDKPITFPFHDIILPFIGAYADVA